MVSLLFQPTAAGGRGEGEPFYFATIFLNLIVTFSLAYSQAASREPVGLMLLDCFPYSSVFNGSLVMHILKD